MHYTTKSVQINAQGSVNERQKSKYMADEIPAADIFVGLKMKYRQLRNLREMSENVQLIINMRRSST